MAPKKSAPASTPGPAILKKAGSASSQKTLLGFFSKTPTSTSSTPQSLPERISPRKSLANKFPAPIRSSQLTPQPSSDAIAPEDDGAVQVQASCSSAAKGLPSPVSADEAQTNGVEEHIGQSTPSRKAKKLINYMESDSEVSEDDIVKRRPRARGRNEKPPPNKRRKVSDSEDEDVYSHADDPDDDDDIDDFIVPDDSDDDVKPTKRKKSSTVNRKREPSDTSTHFSGPGRIKDEDTVDLELPETSTATQWKYDPENPQPLQRRSTNVPSKPPGQGDKKKAHMSEPEQRYAWLADVRDMDRNKPDSPEYDSRTLYIPPIAWTKFTAFEQQYWEIKQKWWDTIVFFKKGKFYELYEKDATIGHQLFDLKLTDRVNMRMVGVPESSLEHWASQFVAKGYKIARVDQQETALGKEMRERDDDKVKSKHKPSKTDKIIKRELACVLTAGTLVDGTMLQSDMSTYCVAIKESEVDQLPAFGVSFVDTSTGQFHIAQWTDDSDLTKFETFVAQIRPQELLLEKGGIGVKAMRILKNNTSPTTIWNYLRPSKEFWEAHITAKEIDACDYFPDGWPTTLARAKEQDLLMSSLGALIQYLRSLKIEKELITIGNFTIYDPIRKASTLVLDGQTLINLEIFNNSFDGGVDGTLFQLLNRCITPFGKRMLKQWVCHPLMDMNKINARLDAVDSLNADTKVRDRFTSQMTKMPDLERLISRIHAGTCKPDDFVRVLDGFEQIDHTMSLLRGSSGNSKAEEGVIGQLIAAMPDLESRLEYWSTAFDRKKGREHGVLVPERGIEQDFDDSQDYIEEIEKKLQALLEKQKKELGAKNLHYRDVGKEVYQLEVPVKIKVPKHWDQMSATQAFKRYYFPELRSLVRRLQEAQETHAQIVKDVTGRFYKRFDEHYEIWLAATRVIAQLDCLISLAKASQSLGEPACRPVFVDDGRSVMQLINLRHPCVVDNVDDFIPNDIVLGGETPNLTLLTGANAAGKSTVLRMTCIAVIMAQVGCYLPCSSARLTPVDRIMSRLGAQDHIFANQSTFFVELAETKKILTDATSRSLVILDELGRGTSSHDGVAVAQAVLHHLASQVGCLGFFATHYHSLAAEFAYSKEVITKRMKILVDEEEKRVTFLYKLEEGVSEGSFGMHCAGMCGIPKRVIARAEETAEAWETTSRLGQKLKGRMASSGEEVIAEVPLGVVSDIAAILRDEDTRGEEVVSSEGQERMLVGLLSAVECL